MLICYGFSSSFCTVERALAALAALKNQGHRILPVCSFHFASTDTRFGKAKEILSRIEEVSGEKMISTLADAEPVGPKDCPDLMIIAPCTGNTLAKLRAGIYDTPLTLAAKAHLRNGKPLLLALATNDGLSGNFENLAALYQRKNVFFVPLLQDDVEKKPFSLVADFERIPKAAKAALSGRQLLPLFLTAP
jgi:dipicolinate synthase subunit B